MIRQRLAIAVAVNLCYLTVWSVPSALIAGENGGSSLTGTGSSLTGEVSDLEGLIDELNGEISESEVTVPLPSDVLFDYDRADIKDEAIPTLGKLEQAISKLNPQQVRIEGHTDSDGAEDYNLQLSQQRAEAVAAWLVQNTDMSSDLLTAKGYGETQPIADNQKPTGEDNPEGRAENRRVEIIIPQ